MSNRYGILAFPARHSLSPAMHNAVFKSLGIDAKYEIFEISESGVEDFMKGARKNINGLSVSLPYKEKIIKYVDFVDEDAKKIGAVNTIKNDNGRFFGYNTDFMGAEMALKEGAKSLHNKRVMVVGAGGAARAVIYGLLKEKAFVTILNRHLEKAKQIAEDFHYLFNQKIEYLPLEAKSNIPNSDILIHATSAWTTNPAANREEVETLFPDEFVNKFNVVMDVSYGDPKGRFGTPLTEKALELGKKTITGDRMLLFQAAAQFKIFTGKEAPIQVMEGALSSAS